VAEDFDFLSRFEKKKTEIREGKKAARTGQEHEKRKNKLQIKKFQTPEPSSES
jgi:hypothetical protein